MASPNAQYIESKLNEAVKYLLAAQTEIADALESAEDSESHSTAAGAKKLFDSTSALIRSANREKILVKHAGFAPKTSTIVRGLN